jgi:hypothetical protein
MPRVLRDRDTGVIIIDFNGLTGAPATLIARFLMRAMPTDGSNEPQKLARYETLAGRISAAMIGKLSLRATISGKLVSLNRHGSMAITPEPTRRRGRTRPET